MENHTMEMQRYMATINIREIKPCEHRIITCLKQRWNN